MLVCSDPDNTVGTPSSQTDPLNATDSPQGTLICHKLSKLDENVFIYVHFYHVSKFLKDKNQKNLSLLQIAITRVRNLDLFRKYLGHIKSLRNGITVFRRKKQFENLILGF